jgi:hypothetical protein
MDYHLHQRWLQLFKDTNEDNDGDTTMAESIQNEDPVNPYLPFASELDWRIARWIIKDGVGHKSLDRLLAIPGVCIYHFHFLWISNIKITIHRLWKNLGFHSTIHNPFTK